MWAIDFGSTNTGIARWNRAEGRPRMVELPNVCRRPGGADHLEAPTLVPSAVEAFENLDFWSKAGKWRPLASRVFWGRQGFIGRRAHERNTDIPQPSFAIDFKVVLGQSPLRTVARLGRKPLSAREVVRLFFRELLREVRETTGERIRDLVLTTPVDAYESYRAEMMEALKLVGVKRVRFVDEPVAAAIGYGLGLKQNRLALVVDFGGGTLDIALVSLAAKEMEQGTCRVIAKAGRPLGGRVVDDWLLDDLCRQLKYPVPSARSGETLAQWGRMMRSEACRLKEALFFEDEQVFFPMPPDEFHRFEERVRGETPHIRVTKDELRMLLEERGLYRTLEACTNEVMERAAQEGITEQAVEDVLMVGGSTLLPGVYPIFEKRFGRDVVRAWQPFEAVAFGASAYAADVSAQSDYIVHDYAFVTHDLETHEKQYSVIIPQGTRFPTQMDFWKRPLVPTCSLGTPETIFKLVICEVGKKYGDERKFIWDKDGQLHKLGGAAAPAVTNEKGGESGGDDGVVIPLNDANPTLGYLRPPHPPGDRKPRLEIAFGVNAERWLCATVYDLRSKKYMMREQPVVRLL
ncbi:MAG: Hsp70 family protein [Myxococcales bacterium]|nr:Hsp70 family protein [Myxococcales bacterium]